jgi:hypothetical protein
VGAYLISQQVWSRNKPSHWEGQAISAFLAHPLTALQHFLRHDRRGGDRLLLLNLDLKPADIFLQLSDQPPLFGPPLGKNPPNYRVYALSGSRGGRRFRALWCIDLYGKHRSPGTFGGLVATAPRFAYILRGALERLRTYSNDRICADHEPVTEVAIERPTAQPATDACL